MFDLMYLFNRRLRNQQSEYYQTCSCTTGSQPALSDKRIVLIDPKPSHIHHSPLTAPWSNRVSALTPGTVNLLKGKSSADFRRYC